MAQHIWTILCSRAIVDERTKQISLLDVVEQINFAGKLPPQEIIDKGVNIPIRMELVSFWTRTNKDIPEKFEIKVVLIGANEKKYDPSVMSVNLGSTRNARQVISIDSIPFAGFGGYCFLIEVKEHNHDEWHEVARVPFVIIEENEETE